MFNVGDLVRVVYRPDRNYESWSNSNGCDRAETLALNKTEMTITSEYLNNRDKQVINTDGITHDNFQVHGWYASDFELARQDIIPSEQELEI